MILADIYVLVDDYGPDGAAGTYRERGDTFQRIHADAAALDKALASHCLPPLAEWEENTDEPGRFHTSQIEDADGSPNNDGKFIVDYDLRVQHCEPVPYVRPTPAAKV